MSSHREAPGISKDPVADNTDLYAFVSPDKSGWVTILANFIPLEFPAGGPNFFEFGDDVTYDINISNDRSRDTDITYRFRFETVLRNDDTFLYNTGPISSLNDPNWNRRQFYSVSRVEGGTETVLANDLACPPVNIGPRSTPNYDVLASAAIHTLKSGEVVFAGQRNEGFFVDLGSIFDLGTLRPFENLHLIPSAAAAGVDGTRGFNVHTIALQVRKRLLTKDGTMPTDPASRKAVIGVRASASRRSATMLEEGGDVVETGPWRQVSRLGNPLFNEVIVPVAERTGGTTFHRHATRRSRSTSPTRSSPGCYPSSTRGVPQPRRVHEGTSRPASDPADRDPEWRDRGLPELHRHRARRHAPSQHGDPTRQLAEPLRDPWW
jgi:hypothetical protein